MEAPVVRFAGLLRNRGVRISPAETLDALRAIRAVRLSSRAAVRESLRATLIKEARDERLFDELFEEFFSPWLATEGNCRGHGHAHDHDEPDAAGVPTDIKISEQPPDFDDPSHSHGAPEDVAKYFDDDQLATAKRMHKEGNRIDLAGLSSELMLGETDALDESVERLRHVLHLRRLSNPGAPGDFAFDAGEVVDADLSVGSVDHLPPLPGSEKLDPDELAALRERVDGAIANLPELLKGYLERLMELEQPPPKPTELNPAYRMAFDEDERRRMDALLRRLGRQLRGAQSQHRKRAARGRLNASRTMRRNMRYGGLPFDPVMAAKREDKPRLVLLVDVSLSVRNTARFTLHLVYGLQSLFSQVRTFAFVADLVEVTPYLSTSELDESLGKVFGGEVLDVDANSNYGRALEQFHSEYLSAINRRTTVLVLGDGRGNRNPPNFWALDDITRRAKQTIWLTPEPEKYWHLGASDMDGYAELCDRVELVRDLDQLEAVAGDILKPV
ncbi:MAG: VWA domain-containing protein [Solirubrobacterales bacterium]|nr:VWA domain-containing protein [Solirubrobacterales bacterium]